MATQGVDFRQGVAATHRLRRCSHLGLTSAACECVRSIDDRGVVGISPASADCDGNHPSGPDGWAVRRFTMAIRLVGHCCHPGKGNGHGRSVTLADADDTGSRSARRADTVAAGNPQPEPCLDIPRCLHVVGPVGERTKSHSGAGRDKAPAGPRVPVGGVRDTPTAIAPGWRDNCRNGRHPCNRSQRIVRRRVATQGLSRTDAPDPTGRCTPVPRGLHLMGWMRVNRGHRDRGTSDGLGSGWMTFWSPAFRSFCARWCARA